MANTSLNARWYTPWPLEGVKLSRQWAHLRKNHEEAKATIRSTLLDVNTDRLYFQQERGLRGFEFGKWDYTKRYRWVHSASDDTFKLQRNDGTQTAPSWTDLIVANTTGGITYVSPSISGDLDMNGYNIVDVNLINNKQVQPRFSVTDSNLSNVFYLVERITFDRESGFYVTGDSNDQPVVSSDIQFGKSRKYSVTPAAQEWQINHGFGVRPQIAQVFDDSDRIITPNTADLSDPDTSYFYFTNSQAGYAVISTGGLGAQNLRPLLTIRGATADNSITEYTLADQLNFSDNDFYLSNRATGKKAVVNLKHLIEDESGNVSIVTNPKSITFDTGGDTTVHGNLNVEGRFKGGAFYLNDLQDVNAPAPADNQILSYDSATGKWIPVDETAGGGAGETNTASALGGDTDVFKQKAGVDFEFRGITAGSLISLAEGASAISVSVDEASIDHGGIAGLNDDDHTQYTLADGTRAFSGNQSMGSNKLTSVTDPTSDQDAATKLYVDQTGGGFYGVIFKESEAGGAVMRDDTLVVDSASFYLTGRPDGKPLLSLLRPVEDGLFNINRLNDGAFAAGSSISMTVTESGGNIVFTPTSTTGGTVTVQFQGTNYTWTPSAINLTAAAADTAPTEEFVYLTRAGSTISIARGTSWPAVEHARIATVVVQTASGVASNGALKIHAWTDHVHENLTSGDGTRGNRGHLHALGEKFRSQHADWSSGMATTAPQAGTELDIVVGSGTGFQLHKHTTPAFDTSATDSIYVVNDPDAAYTKLGILNTTNLDKYSGGGSIAATARFNVVVWAVISENASDSKLFLNLPASGYTNDAAALADGENTANYTVPSAYKGTALLLGRLTLKKTAAGGGTLSNINDDSGGSHSPTIQASLLGTPPTVFAGGSATGSGEANTASNLGATVGAEGVWFQKAGLDLEFKSLVGGTDIGLSSDNDEITITSEGGPGFYGVIFEDGTNSYRTDKLSFNDANFYLSNDSLGQPVANIEGLSTGVTLQSVYGGIAQPDSFEFRQLESGGVGNFGANLIFNGSGDSEFDFQTFTFKSFNPNVERPVKVTGQIILKDTAAHTDEEQVVSYESDKGVQLAAGAGYRTLINGDPVAFAASGTTTGVQLPTTAYRATITNKGFWAKNNVEAGSAFYGPIMQPKQYLSGQTTIGGNIHDVNMDWTENSTFFMPVSRSYTMHTPILAQPGNLTSASDAQTVHLVTKNLGFYNLMWSNKYIFPGGDQTPISKGENVIDKWTLTYVPALDKVIVTKDANCFY